MLIIVLVNINHSQLEQTQLGMTNGTTICFTHLEAAEPVETRANVAFASLRVNNGSAEASPESMVYREGNARE